MISIGVVGCGRWGREHLNAYQLIDDVQLVAVSDSDARVAARAAADYGIPSSYDDHRTMLEAHEFDLVSVCTLPASHRDITVDLFAAGANVLCEKPLAMNYAEAADMLAASRKANRFLSVGYENRFSESAQYLKGFVDSGALGRPVYTRAWLFCEFVWWGRAHNIMRELCGGGTVTSGGIHALDLAMWLTGFPAPTTVSASMAQTFPRKRGAAAPTAETVDIYDVEDLASAHIRFEDGSWMTLESAAGGIDLILDSENISMNTELGLRIAGQDATIEFAPLRVLQNTDRGEIVDATPQDLPKWDIPRAMRAEIADVVGAVRDARPPLVRGEQALTLELIRDGIYRSAVAGAEVSLRAGDAGVPAPIGVLSSAEATR
jgi:predicted dehydrogenase